MRHIGWAAVVGVVGVFAAPARAVDPDEIDRAVEKGVRALQKMQRADGTWPWAEIGATSLAGLALLECGVKDTDGSVQKAATAVRKAAVSENRTYSLALSLMFLDRLGESADIPLIEAMAVRLMAGQGSEGGWGYTCPEVDAAEVRRLEAALAQKNELVGKRQKPDGKRAFKDLPKEIQDQVTLINRGGKAAGANDNSNTQFAMLALWVARRHGIPTDLALAHVDTRFRKSQNADGGWSYSYHDGDRGGGHASTAAMTAAGVLGLALGHGVAGELQKDGKKKNVLDPAKDGVLKAGLLALGTSIDHPVGKAKPRAPGRRGVPQLGDRGGRSYYFLWSVERVGVILNLDTIGKKDWYQFGAEVLLTNQRGDGKWMGEYGESGADTCFALLFLRRSNLARDLATTLKGKLQDPGEVTLKSGGVGGGSLVKDGGETLKPGVGTESGKPDGGNAKVGAESVRLAEELVKASADKQGELLGKLRDGKGATHTEALAVAIPKLAGETKRKARDALADRMARLTDESLGTYLGDADAEIRRGAVLGLAMRDSTAHLPKMADLLLDADPSVARAAHASLKALTNQDFGPPANAARADAVKAVAAWKDWWASKK